MNIISNCCLGGFITRDILHEQFSNPFVWAWITTDDVCFLAEHYGNIDFRKFTIAPHDGKLIDDCCFDVIVDRCIKIVNAHYQFKSGCVNIQQDHERNLVVHNKIWEFVVKKYIERVKRMYSLREHPVFALCDNRNGCGTFTHEQVNFLSRQTKYKIVFCSEIDYSDKNSNSFLFIHKNGNLLHEIVSEHGNNIKDFYCK